MKKKSLSSPGKEILATYGLHASDFPGALHLSFAKGEYLSREGEALTYLFFVVSGRAKVMLHLSNGKQLLLAYFISKGLIGDIELMTDVETNQATLQAVTAFECIALPLGEYRAALKNNNKFINYVGKELAEKLIGRAVNGAINILQPLETRLCAYIMQMAKPGLSAERLIFGERIADVAIMLGASYRHVQRSLLKLCKDGILLKQLKCYHIINQEALAGMSGDLYVLR